jgi:inositol oxygenase
VGCAYSGEIVYPQYFAQNPDSRVPEYQTLYGIYKPNCGLENVHMSWGHDEYIYRVAQKYLPEPAHYMLRYHSFYAAHRHGAYRHLMSAHDERMFDWVNKFNRYDLYSKGSAKPNLQGLKPFYEDLIAEFFPAEIGW